jgi:hypothetical protein
MRLDINTFRTGKKTGDKILEAINAKDLILLENNCGLRNNISKLMNRTDGAIQLLHDNYNREAYIRVRGVESIYSGRKRHWFRRK